ncbi:MAG: hypothetical protein E6G82_08090 [Alphaproteobacteria bacterium]|nr:MAG: hypothetical protein E6G82_08090 [Alphaproteobacteria bacterium]
MPSEERRAASLKAQPELAGASQAPVMADAVVADTDVTPTVKSVMDAISETTLDSDAPASVAGAALSDWAEMLPPQSLEEQLATVSTPDPVPNDLKETVSSIEIVDGCLSVDICIDRYLWALYQRTPKEDTIKVHEQRKVTVKRRGKTVTVTKSFTRLLDEDFTWKDPKAAEKARMSMIDFVVGGMDRSFKLKLFHMLRAAEEAGLSPGITSAFRDDYRQSIASGLKAATERSYHGGSFRGGYGYGLAADVVSVNGATQAQRWISSESLWKWIDAHGKEFGIGRPYLHKDPPHLAPIDGKEYAAHQRGTKVQHAGSDKKKRNRLAVRDDPRAIRSTSSHRPKAEMRVAAQVRK